MKKLIVGVFSSSGEAEMAIDHLHKDLEIDTEDISYLYRDASGNVQEGDSSEVASPTAGEGAKKGAKIGGTVGALAGIAAVAGIIPIFGPFLAAGPLVAALGLGSAVGTTAVGAAAGVVAGGLIGALSSMGVSKDKTEHYADRIEQGGILVTVHAEKDADVANVLNRYGADDVNSYQPAM